MKDQKCERCGAALDNTGVACEKKSKKESDFELTSQPQNIGFHGETAVVVF